MNSIKKTINKFISSKGIRKITRRIAYPILQKRVLDDLKELSGISSSSIRLHDDNNRVLYVRTDMWLKGGSSNGALSHTEGVLNALVAIGENVKVISSYPLSIANVEGITEVCTPSGLLKNMTELEEMEYNGQVIAFIEKAIEEYQPAFIYHRYGRNSYGVSLAAHRKGIPVVIEYNGSEIWMSHHWYKPLRYEKIAAEVELSVLKTADLVVCNAQPLKDEMSERGVDGNRILVLPNGVNEKMFNPSVSSALIREKLSYSENNVVVTFVGSFGPWHGAEVLASTVKEAVNGNPNLRYMFVGKGGSLETVHEIISKDSVEGYVSFLGPIPHDEIPHYLAASDILVSPQIPNPDGSPFFGSPTKLFEYMAMGKAIIASDLDQIGEILSDEETALLVEPGNKNAMTDAIVRLSKDCSLRERIGNNAYQCAISNYTWNEHVGIIINSLKTITN